MRKMSMVPQKSETQVETYLQALISNYQSPATIGPALKCIVIGDAGSGKSTLIKFLANNGGTLTVKPDFSIECSEAPQQIYVMQISNPISCAVDDVHLVEAINMEQISNFDNYIGQAFTLSRMLKETSKVKLLLVVESDTIYKNEDRFSIFFQHLAKILTDFPAIKYSVGLVVTKVDPKTHNRDVQKRVTTLLRRELRQHQNHPSRNAQIKHNLLLDQLHTSTLLNCDSFLERYNKNLEELFKTLLEVRITGSCFKVATPKYITVFRKPNDCGLVSDLLSDNRTQIKEMLMYIDYSRRPVSFDLSYALWESHRDHVANLITNIKSKLWSLSEVLYEHYDLKILDCSNIFELKRTLHFESSMFSTMLPNAQQMFDYIVTTLVDLLEEPTSQAQKFKTFVDDDLDFLVEMLTYLQGGEKLFHDHEFESIGEGLVEYFAKWKLFLSFLLALEKFVSSEDANLDEVFAFDYSCGWIVNQTNFLEFLQKTLELGIDVDIDTFPAIDVLFLKHLNELLIRKHRICLPDVKRDFRKTIVSKQFVLVLGPAGSGKSTLIQSLTGSLPNQIRSENNVALTVTHNGVQYIECPNWTEEPDFQKRLETMLLLEDLLMIMHSFKVIFVLDMTRTDMSKWLLRAIRFFKNFEAYEKAIGFSVTKADASKSGRFLRDILTELQTNAGLTTSELQFFSKMFTQSENQYHHVELSNSALVDRVIEGLNFVIPNTDDLDYTCDLKAEIALMFLNRALDQHYNVVLNQPFDCYDTLDELEVIAEKVNAFINLTTDAEFTSMENVVASLLALAKIGPDICENYRKLISEYNYSSMLTSLRMEFYEMAQRRNLNVLASGIRLSAAMALVTMLVEVDRYLAKYETQKNKQTWEFESIDSSNVAVFLTQLFDSGYFGQYSLDLLNCTNTNLIRNLQNIYARTSLKPTIAVNRTDKTLRIAGNFVVCSDLDKTSLEEANEIEIFATDTVFIDVNINSMAKLKKIYAFAPKVEIIVKPTGIVSSFVVCQKLSFDLKSEFNWFGPIRFCQPEVTDLSEAPNLTKFGIHNRMEAYTAFILDANDQTVPTKRSAEFKKFLTEALATYTTKEFEEKYGSADHLPLQCLIKQLECLNELCPQTKSTQPNLFWYKSLYSELLAYQTSNTELSVLKLAIIRKLQLLTLSKINTFHDRSIPTRLKVNMADHCQKIKQKLKEINNLSPLDALLHTKRKLKQKFSSSIASSRGHVVKLSAELGKAHSMTPNFGEITDQVPMQVTRQCMLEVVEMYDDLIKGFELTLKVAFQLTEQGPHTTGDNRLVFELTNYCNKIITKFENANNRSLNRKLEILAEAFVDLTDSEVDAAIRQNLENEMDAIREDLQNGNVAEEECPLVQNARIVQELSKNDKLYMVRKRYVVFNVSKDLYSACENDTAKVELAFDVVQPFLEDSVKLADAKSQAQEIMLRMHERFSGVHKDLTSFFQDPGLCRIDVSFQKFKSFIQAFASKLDLHKFQFSLLGRVETALFNLGQSFKYLQDFHTHSHVIHLFWANDTTNLTELNDSFGEFFRAIDAQVKADLLLKEYNRGVVLFEANVFPFAAKCLPSLKALIYNQSAKFNGQDLTVKMFETLVDNIKWVRRMTADKSSSIPVMLRQRMTRYNFTTNSAERLYVWRHEQHYGEIFKLLKGEKVYLTADIQQGYAKDVVKFSNLELAFCARDTNYQSVVDAHLKRATINMRHSGQSFYRLNNKIFKITTNDQQLVYSCARGESGQASSTNLVVKILKNGEPVLSPFTTWKLQVVLKDKKSDFITLFKERVAVDLLLVGSCCYLDDGNSVDESAEYPYLSVGNEQTI